MAASLSNIGQLFGSILMGVLAGAIGRKKTIMALCLPLFTGWMIVGLSEGKVTMLYLGRVFQGVGVMSSVTQIYLVEVADAQRRQKEMYQKVFECIRVVSVFERKALRRRILAWHIKIN